jgi:hypothetical protein
MDLIGYAWASAKARRGPAGIDAGYPPDAALRETAHRSGAATTMGAHDGPPPLA